MAVRPGIHTQLDIGILADVSILVTGFGRFRTVFYMQFLGGLGQFLYILLIYALFELKEIASHTSMQMVRSNEKNNIIYSNSMSEQMRNVEPHARLSGNNIIYPISMNHGKIYRTYQRNN